MVETDTRAPRRTPPLIGVTTYLERAVQGPWDERFGMVPETYLLAVEEGGGTPLLLPPQPLDDAVIDRVLGALDGLVLSGGADVDPARYGTEPGPHTQTPRRDRDAWEAALLTRAIAVDLPVLAICRGVQLLNVVLGGTLTQHVPDITTMDHGDLPGAFSATVADVVPGTRLHDVLGAQVRVECHHHQVIDRVAEGLVVAAHSADGLIEAVELPSSAFVVGVQWHPEQTADDRRLFASLVDATGGSL